MLHFATPSSTRHRHNQNCWSSSSGQGFTEFNVTIWCCGPKRHMSVLWHRHLRSFTQNCATRQVPSAEVLQIPKSTLCSSVFLTHGESRGGQRGHPLYQPANALNKTRQNTNHKKTIDNKHQTLRRFGTGLPSSGSLLKQRNISRTPI